MSEASGGKGDLFADAYVVRAGEKFPEPVPTKDELDESTENETSPNDVSVAAGGVTGVSTVP